MICVPSAERRLSSAVGGRVGVRFQIRRTFVLRDGDKRGSMRTHRGKQLAVGKLTQHRAS